MDGTNTGSQFKRLNRSALTALPGTLKIVAHLLTLFRTHLLPMLTQLLPLGGAILGRLVVFVLAKFLLGMAARAHFLRYWIVARAFRRKVWKRLSALLCDWITRAAGSVDRGWDWPSLNVQHACTAVNFIWNYATVAG
jgi:hypothetical protein